MLYGSRELQEDVIGVAKKWANENDYILLYGAMVGSVSKGVNYIDSDYDTRFLYLKRDFPQKIYIPSMYRESELKRRFYPENDRVFEWIPFWEATSFFQFLIEPSFDNHFSVGLYNVVGWTFQSPFSWDPYGLKSKILPLLNRVFYAPYEIEFHMGRLKAFRKEWNEKRIITKNYLYSIFSAATIEWSKRFNTQPPIDMQSLLLSLDLLELWEVTHRMLESARCNARKVYVPNSTKLQESRWVTYTDTNEKINSYLMKIFEENENVQLRHISTERKEKYKEIVNRIYDIIYHSIFEREGLEWSRE